MKYILDKLSGQVAVIQVIYWGASAVAILSTFFWSQLGSTNQKVEVIVSKTTTLEANYISIKEGQILLQADVKELLQRIPKK